MSEETDEVVRHDNKGVADFGSPGVLGRELVSREVVLDFLDSVLRVSPSAIEVVDGLCGQCQRSDEAAVAVVPQFGYVREEFHLPRGLDLLYILACGLGSLVYFLSDHNDATGLLPVLCLIGALRNMNAICHLRPFSLRSQMYLDRVIEAACYDIGQLLLFQTVEYITTEEAAVHRNSPTFLP